MEAAEGRGSPPSGSEQQRQQEREPTMGAAQRYTREELLALRDTPGCRDLPPGLEADDLRCAAPLGGRHRPLARRRRAAHPAPAPSTLSRAAPACRSDLQESCFFDKAPTPDAGIYLGPQRGPGGPGARAPFTAGPARRAAGVCTQGLFSVHRGPVHVSIADSRVCRSHCCRSQRSAAGHGRPRAVAPRRTACHLLACPPTSPASLLARPAGAAAGPIHSRLIEEDERAAYQRTNSGQLQTAFGSPSKPQAIAGRGAGGRFADPSKMDRWDSQKLAAGPGAPRDPENWQQQKTRVAGAGAGDNWRANAGGVRASLDTQRAGAGWGGGSTSDLPRSGSSAPKDNGGGRWVKDDDDWRARKQAGAVPEPRYDWSDNRAQAAAAAAAPGAAARGPPPGFHDRG